MGGHFIAPYKSILFLSHLGSLGALFRSSLGALRARLDVRGALFTAQAAQIRVGVCFYFLCSNRHIFYVQAAYIRFSGVRFDVLASLFDAQASQIRSVAYFMSLCKKSHLIFDAQAAYTRVIIGFRTMPRSLVDPQAAQICVGLIFSVSVFKQTHHLSWAGCVYTRHR